MVLRGLQTDFCGLTYSYWSVRILHRSSTTGRVAPDQKADLSGRGLIRLLLYVFLFFRRDIRQAARLLSASGTSPCADYFELEDSSSSQQSAPLCGTTVISLGGDIVRPFAGISF